MRRQRPPFEVLRGGEPIREYAVIGSVDPHISYNQKFTEFDACVSCGLNLWNWWTGLYPPEFKAKVIAFHNMRNLVKLHTEDALGRAQRRKMKDKS